MKIKVQLTERILKNNLQKIEHMLLYDKIKLTDISRPLRLQNKTLYIMAFRASREKSSPVEYMMNLKTLSEDILSCSNRMVQKSLTRIFDTYINFSPFYGDENFEHYKKIIYQNILQ